MSNKVIQEKPREIPVMREVDVLVVGGGPAGIAAAVGAARAGAKTLLIERFGCLGGNITLAGVESFAWYRHEGTVEAGGIAIELEEKAIEWGIATKEVQSESMVFDTEMFKPLLDDFVLEAGVEVLFHTLVTDSITEDGLIKGVITESKSGRQAILANRIIDCSGDADIAAFVGAPFTMGEKDDLMGVTTTFVCKSVETKKFKDYIDNDLKPTYRDWGGGECWKQITTGKEDDMFSPFIERPFIEAREEGIINPEPGVAIGGTYSNIDDETGEVLQMNMVFMSGFDCTDVEDLSRAEIVGRRSVIETMKGLRAKVPGFENSKVRNFSSAIGTRESRKIKGRAYLTREHVTEQGRFEDTIGIFPEFIDGRSYLIIPTTGRYYQIPYGCMVPENIDNLLVAGRSISGDEVAHCSYRNMSCCVVTGQAAGVAAAISLKMDTTTSKVDVAEVQNELKRQKVRIH